MEFFDLVESLLFCFGFYGFLLKTGVMVFSVFTFIAKNQ